MDIRPIRDEESYSWALKAIEPCFVHGPESGTPDADRFDLLATFIRAYEARVYR